MGSRSGVIAVFCVLFASSVAAAADTISTDTTWQGNRRSYMITVPPGEHPAKPMPLVVLLHGSGRRGKIMVDKWKKLADGEGVILVAPDSLDSRTWKGPHDGPGFLRKLVDEVAKSHPVDSSRVYLFGHSAGGHFALLIGLMESEYFAAVAVHAGAIPTGSETFIGVAKRKIPIAIWAGDRDRLVPEVHVRQTFQLLTDSGFPVELSMMARHDHDYYSVSAKVNKEAWSFLSQYSLDRPSRYVDYGDRDEAPQ